jgi:hypothetical protein
MVSDWKARPVRARCAPSLKGVGKLRLVYLYNRRGDVRVTTEGGPSRWQNGGGSLYFWSRTVVLGLSFINMRGLWAEGGVSIYSPILLGDNPCITPINPRTRPLSTHQVKYEGGGLRNKDWNEGSCGPE